MYRRALEVGILPSEFWNMTIQEAEDTVSSRNRQKSDEIYTLSGMIRVAVLSCFSAEVKFPDPLDEQKVQDWKNSKKYLKALQNKQQGGA
jgi:hypothetical protein